MKNSILKFYMTAIFFCSTAMLFAQNPGTDNGGTGDAGLGGDDPSAPIDDLIPVLALMGIVLVFFRFRALKAQKMRRLNRKY